MLGVLDVRIWTEAFPRASGEVDRVSGLHCTGDTRVRARVGVDPYNLMVASHGHDPHHDLLLLGVACTSTLLSYAVGIEASFDHFTHIYASRNANARIFLKLGTVTVFDTVSSYSASSARLPSRPSSASPRCLLSIRNILIKAHIHHAPQTKFKEEEDDFLDKLHRQHGQGI